MRILKLVLFWLASARAWWKVCLCIRSFHSSIKEITLPQCWTLFTFPLGLAWTQKAWDQVWAAKLYPINWCAGRKAGVGAMRDHFKWPSFGCLSSSCLCLSGDTVEALTDDCLIHRLWMTYIYIYGVWPVSGIHGHRTLKAPHPVWSAQLTRVPPS